MITREILILKKDIPRNLQKKPFRMGENVPPARASEQLLHAKYFNGAEVCCTAQGTRRMRLPLSQQLPRLHAHTWSVTKVRALAKLDSLATQQLPFLIAPSIMGGIHLGRCHEDRSER